MADNKSINFSAKLDELEKIVQDLESANTDLPVAITQFEKGAELAVELQTFLKETELKINKIKTKFETAD